jgi:2-polyprenyl-6-methoxyphenol hydroxylase-like FAD-dependent oxidoreductase
MICAHPTWRTVMECGHWDPVVRFSSTPGCFPGSFPVGPGLMYAFLLAHCAEVPVLSRDERLARFKELAAAFHGNVSPLIRRQCDPARVIVVPVQEVQVPSYYQGRMVLIGDAAHAFPPLLAQGAAMAIEDAVALAESLGQSGDVDQALRSYESRRRPRVETIRAAVRRRTIARGMEGPATPELLTQHPPVFSPSLKAFDELIEDPFTPSTPEIQGSLLGVSLPAKRQPHPDLGRLPGGYLVDPVRARAKRTRPTENLAMPECPRLPS